MPRHRRAIDPGSGKAAAVDAHFEGDAALYDAFLATCKVQFALDAAAGRGACSVGDLASLRRLAHNLKSALVMLGRADLCDLAARVEAHAAAGDLSSARVPWNTLETGLLKIQAP